MKNCIQISDSMSDNKSVLMNKSRWHRKAHSNDIYLVFISPGQLLARERSGIVNE